ncbi:MAG: glucose-6-phosphate dehydrogenase assembly protein OpcA [Nocardioides sp.]
MTRTLTDTTSAAIAAEFVRARTHAGSPAMGMVMTLIIVVDEDCSADALEAARAASHEHPARVLAVVSGSARGAAAVDAEVTVGTGWSGEMALIRLSGEVVRHPESVVLPLLLPDSPVVAWWPGAAPVDPSTDPLGRLATRRITDAHAVETSRAKALHVQCASYAPGNTDLAWTRLTPWRALLAAALDQQPFKVTAGSVSAERLSPGADLMVAWLASRLKVDIKRRSSDGPGITEVVLETAKGPIRITRDDGRHAVLSTPGNPDRPIALARRDVPELLAEELRRLDEDDIYAQTARFLTRRIASRGGTTRKATKK